MSVSRQLGVASKVPGHEVMGILKSGRARVGRILTLCVAAAPTHNTLWVYGYRRGRAGRGALVQWRVSQPASW